jgi:hypothetical protein
MRKLWVLTTVMLVFMALYYLVTTSFKPSQPQVIVVKPSGAQTPAQTATPSQAEPQPQSPPSVHGPFACAKAVYLKVGGTSLCADVVYSVAKADDVLQVDFQGGIVYGVFTIASVPCPVSTTPQGVFISCRAQIMIPVSR